MADVSREEHAIRQLIEQWHRATAAGDLTQLLGLMAPDVVFLTPGHAPMRGRDAFVAGFKSAIERFEIASSGEVQEVVVFGEWAYCWSHLSVTMSPRAGGQAVRRTGYTLTIFRRTPTGAWMLARDANMLG